MDHSSVHSQELLFVLTVSKMLVNVKLILAADAASTTPNAMISASTHDDASFLVVACSHSASTMRQWTHLQIGVGRMQGKSPHMGKYNMNERYRQEYVNDKLRI